MKKVYRPEAKSPLVVGLSLLQLGFVLEDTSGVNICYYSGIVSNYNNICRN